MAKAWDCPRKSLQGWRSVRTGCPYWPSQGRGERTDTPAPSRDPQHPHTQTCGILTEGRCCSGFICSVCQRKSSKEEKTMKKKKSAVKENFGKNKQTRKKRDTVKNWKRGKKHTKTPTSTADTAFGQPTFWINYFLFETQLRLSASLHRAVPTVLGPQTSWTSKIHALETGTAPRIKVSTTGKITVKIKINYINA